MARREEDVTMARALGGKQRSTGAAIAVLLGLVLSSWIAPPGAGAQGAAPNTYVGSEVCQACHPVPLHWRASRQWHPRAPLLDKEGQGEVATMA